MCIKHLINYGLKLLLFPCNVWRQTQTSSRTVMERDSEQQGSQAALNSHVMTSGKHSKMKFSINAGNYHNSLRFLLIKDVGKIALALKELSLHYETGSITISRRYSLGYFFAAVMHFVIRAC